jgi:hypothetical protein
MYAEHVPKINAGMRHDPEAFIRGVMFAVCSIRQPVEDVPGMLDDISRHGANAEALAMPMKHGAWEYLQHYGTRLWLDVCAMDTRDALIRLLSVPGLGIVKAAFVLQFLGHDIGCLDTRNLRRESISMRAFTNHADIRSTSVCGYRSQQINLYFKLAGGRAKELWDTWCAEVSKDRPHVGTPEEVSALHLSIIA